MSYTHVHTPLKIGPITVKNRIARPAHATNHGKGFMSDDLIAYHEARAHGGAALSILEVGSVHPTSPFSINLWDPALEPGYRKLVDACRPHGMKLFQQLWHCGHHMLPLDGSPPWSASDVPGPETHAVPIPMTKAMIDDIVEAYAICAKRCEDYGLDGVEVHCAHGYLPAQFLSPNTNLREDDYGGSFENRARFMLEVLEAVRGSVSANVAVGVRLAADMTVNGLGPEENLAAALLLEERGLIDYVNLSMGSYHDNPHVIGGMHEPTGYELPTSTPISRRVKSPTIVIGRFRTLDDADVVIRSGDADMVGMVRGMIADSDLVNKSLAGQAEQVRPCIGCNQGCLGHLATTGHMECAVNPSVGHELRVGDHLLRPASQPKTVLVIGGGPAGLEAARVAALRGHKVILAEAEPLLGGALKIAARVPTRHGIEDISKWLEAEVYRLGVDVRLSTYLDVDDVVEVGADVVIVATGSTPRMDGIQHSHPGQPVKGIDLPHVISSHELLMNSGRNLGRTAVVIDDIGHYEGLGAADFLLERGLAVTYVTRLREVAPMMQSSWMTEPFLRRTSGKPFRAMTRTRAIAIDGTLVLVGPQYLTDDAKNTEQLSADTVVFISANRSNRDIFLTLSDRNCDVRIVGDAKAPRYLPTAIREGHIAGATL